MKIKRASLWPNNLKYCLIFVVLNVYTVGNYNISGQYVIWFFLYYPINGSNLKKKVLKKIKYRISPNITFSDPLFSVKN